MPHQTVDNDIDMLCCCDGKGQIAAMESAIAPDVAANKLMEQMVT
jgi:hypothetical protein